MAIRPPSRDGSGRESVEFGIVALGRMVEDAGVEFPATEAELLRELDDPAVPVDVDGNTVRLSVVLGEVEGSRFASERGFLERVHPVFEAYRSQRGGGMTSRLRALLPF